LESTVCGEDHTCVRDSYHSSGHPERSYGRGHEATPGTREETKTKSIARESKQSKPLLLAPLLSALYTTLQWIVGRKTGTCGIPTGFQMGSGAKGDLKTNQGIRRTEMMEQTDGNTWSGHKLRQPRPARNASESYRSATSALSVADVGSVVIVRSHHRATTRGRRTMA
jgi:hypothetical protein